MESSERPTFAEVKEYLEGLFEENMSNAYYLALPMAPLPEGQFKILFMGHDQISTMKDACLLWLTYYIVWTLSTKSFITDTVIECKV